DLPSSSFLSLSWVLSVDDSRREGKRLRSASLGDPRCTLDRPDSSWFLKPSSRRVLVLLAGNAPVTRTLVITSAVLSVTSAVSGRPRRLGLSYQVPLLDSPILRALCDHILGRALNELTVTSG
ncbi:hypothetical protein GW17_00002500, partial [Ensete ventricosum]